MAAPLPVIDIAPLVDDDDWITDTPPPADSAVAAVAAEIDRAATERGFFTVVGHGVDPDLIAALQAASAAFFALPAEEKAEIAMVRAGTAWRGWFAVGDELTNGRPDLKEGLYLGVDLPDDDPRVVAGRPLHGRNLVPARPAELADLVPAYLTAVSAVGERVLAAMAVGLGHDPRWFARHTTADPTLLLRVFHYPPGPPDGDWGVAEHTDYGLLTLLLQDDHGGLEVRGVDDTWTAVPPGSHQFVCNLGDMLERLSDGRYRSNAHRVRNTGTAGRISIPLFVDPGWDVVVGPGDATYGDYITAKVAPVFPELFGAISPSAPRSEYS